eukprot:2556736-Amphidinium_carterae.1
MGNLFCGWGVGGSCSVCCWVSVVEVEDACNSGNRKLADDIEVAMGLLEVVVLVVGEVPLLGLVQDVCVELEASAVRDADDLLVVRERSSVLLDVRLLEVDEANKVLSVEKLLDVGEVSSVLSVEKLLDVGE